MHKPALPASFRNWYFDCKALPCNKMAVHACCCQHSCCCCPAGHELFLSNMPLGRKLQLQRDSLHARCSMSYSRLCQHQMQACSCCLDTPQAAARCYHTAAGGSSKTAAATSLWHQAAAQASCNLCCGYRPATASAASKLLSGRCSPVRDALWECWQDAASSLSAADEQEEAEQAQLLRLIAIRQQLRRTQAAAAHSACSCSYCCAPVHCTCTLHSSACQHCVSCAGAAVGGETVTERPQVAVKLAAHLQELDKAVQLVREGLARLESIETAEAKQAIKPPWRP